MLLVLSLAVGGAGGAAAGEPPRPERRVRIGAAPATVRADVGAIREALADEIRASIRERAHATREIHDARVHVRDVWREVFEVCPLDDASAHRNDPVSRIAHTLADAAKDLTPKLGVLIATGAKLLGQLLTAA